MKRAVTPPLVKLDCVATENHIYYYHAEQNGMPVMLTDAEGRVSWQQQSQICGAPLPPTTTSTLTTLSASRVAQPDPIGLLGEFNLYQYAPNPLGWIDPLVLNGCPGTEAGIGNVSSGETLSVSENRAIRSLEEQIQLHERKLRDYINDPYSFDNKNFLRNAPNDEVRQNIINSRI